MDQSQRTETQESQLMPVQEITLERDHPGKLIREPLPKYVSPLEIEEPSKFAEMLKNTFDFEMETKCREIINGIVGKIAKQTSENSTQVKNFLLQIEECKNDVTALMRKVQQESKFKKEVVEVKEKFNAMSQNLYKDMGDMRAENQAMIIKIKVLGDKVDETRKERNLFVNGLERMRQEMKELDALLNEQRAVHDKHIVTHRVEVAKTLQSMDSALSEMAMDRQQLKAMVKNQNFHFTELQKAIGVLSFRADRLEATCSLVPSIQQQIESTDNYLCFYQPMEILTQIHNTMMKALETAPVKQRIDLVETTESHMREILHKLKTLGEQNQAKLLKDNYQVLQLDLVSFTLRQKQEQEELAKREAERKRKTPQQEFDEKLYDSSNLERLQAKVTQLITPHLKKIIADQVEQHHSVTRLYEIVRDFEQRKVRHSSRSRSESDSSESDESSSQESSDRSRSEQNDESDRRQRPKRAREISVSEESDQSETSPKPRRNKRKREPTSSSDESEQSEKQRKPLRRKRQRNNTPSSDSQSSQLSRSKEFKINDQRRDSLQESTRSEQHAEQMKTPLSGGRLRHNTHASVKDVTADVHVMDRSEEGMRNTQSSVQSSMRQTASFQKNTPKNKTANKTKAPKRQPIESESDVESSPITNRQTTLKSSKPKELIKENFKSKARFEGESSSSESIKGIDKPNLVDHDSQLKGQPKLSRRNPKPVSEMNVAKIKQFDLPQQAILETLETPTRKPRASSREKSSREPKAPTVNHMEATEQSNQEKNKKQSKHEKKQPTISSEDSLPAVADAQPSRNAGRTTVGSGGETFSFKGKKDKSSHGDYYSRQSSRRGERKKERDMETSSRRGSRAGNSKETKPEQDSRKQRDDEEEKSYHSKSKRRAEESQFKPDPKRDYRELRLETGQEKRIDTESSLVSKQKREKDSKGGERVKDKDLETSSKRGERSKDKKHYKERSRKRKDFKQSDDEEMGYQSKQIKKRVEDSKTKDQKDSDSVRNPDRPRESDLVSSKRKTDKKDKKEKKKSKKRRVGDEMESKHVSSTMKEESSKSRAVLDKENELRETIEKVQKKMEKMVTREEWDRVNSDVPRVLAELNIMKEKLRIYEDRFNQDTDDEVHEQNLKSIKENINESFSKYKDTRSRIQRLNESDIIGIKDVMLDLMQEVHRISVKQANHEAEKLKLKHNRLPRDIFLLSKDEQTLRRELALLLEDTESIKETVNKELTRLRREHYANLNDIESIVAKQRTQQSQLQNVLDRQGMNDQAMAAIFKIMKLDFSLLTQDEVDRKSVYLMGLTEPKKQSGQNTVSVNTGSIDSDISKARASTRVPIETSVTADNKTKPVSVIALNRNCLTHSDALHNETVLKAFKMACLNYEPSVVEFESVLYKREELIKAMGDLIKFSLAQLKHLDVSLLDHKIHVAVMESKTSSQHATQPTIDYSTSSPNDFPHAPSYQKQSQEYPDWLQQDSIQSIREIETRVKDPGTYTKNLATISQPFTVSLLPHSSTKTKQESPSNRVNSVHKQTHTTAHTMENSYTPRTKSRTLASKDLEEMLSVEGMPTYERPAYLGMSAIKRQQIRTQVSYARNPEAIKTFQQQAHALELQSRGDPLRGDHLPSIRQSRKTPRASYEDSTRIYTKEISLPTSVTVQVTKHK